MHTQIHRNECLLESVKVVRCIVGFDTCGEITLAEASIFVFAEKKGKNFHNFHDFIMGGKNENNSVSHDSCTSPVGITKRCRLLTTAAMWNEIFNSADNTETCILVLSDSAKTLSYKDSKARRFVR